MSDLPYPGLRPFQHDEIDIFFGREEHIDQLITRLGKTQFLAVIGSSGCGKSSLVRAGLLANLVTGFLAKAGTRWWVVEMRPGDRPFARLAESLLKTKFGEVYQKSLKKEFGQDTDLPAMDPAQALAFLQAELRHIPLGLHRVLRETPLPERTNLLLVVDQFEEIFRYCQQGDTNETRANMDTAKAFVALLLAGNRPSTLLKEPRVYVVITMRSDFIGECALFHGLPEAINQGLFLTPRLIREQLHDAIVMPAQVFNGKVEPALVNQLLNEVGNEPDQLPLLQHALARMWDFARQDAEPVVLTLEHYDKVGKLATALSQHADEAYQELNLQQQQIAEILFRSLTERSNTHHDLRRPVKLAEVATIANVPWQQVVEVVDVFRQTGRNFLMPSIEVTLQPDTVLDISHESLIRQWQRLEAWVETEAKSAEFYRRLKYTAGLYWKREAALLHTPELEYAITWRDQNQPSVQWAKRYSEHESEFQATISFLEASITRQTQLQRRQRQLQRRRTLMIVGVVVLLIVIGFLIGVTEQISQQKNKALEAEKKARESEFESQLTNAVLLARLEDYTAARQILATGQTFEQIPIERHRARAWLTEFVNIMSNTTPPPVYKTVGVALYTIAVSAEGRWLATAGKKGQLFLFNLETNQLEKHLVGHAGEDINTLVFCPKSQWVASAGNDQQVIFWSIPEGKEFKRLSTDFKINALAVTAEGAYLAISGEKADIILIKVATNQKIRVLSRQHKAITFSGLAFHPTKPLLASAYEDGQIYLWDWQTGKAVKILKGHASAAYSVNFSSDGRLLVSSSEDKSVRVWDIDSGETLHELHGHQDIIYGVNFLKGNNYLISGSNDQTLRLWDSNNEFSLQVLQGHRGGINDIAIYPKSEKEFWVFSASDDGTVRRWDITFPLPYEKKVQQIDLPGNPFSVAISPSGEQIAVGFEDGALRLYTFPQMTLLGEQKQAHKKEIRCLRFTHDSQLLASGSYDGQAKLWEVNLKGQLKLKQTINEGAGEIYAVSFSPHGEVLAIARDDGQIGLFTLKTKEKRPFKAHDGGVLSVTFDNSGTRLLSGGRDEYTRLWQFNEGKATQLQAFKSQSSVMSVEFSSDNRWIASVGQDLLVHIYQTDNNKEEKTLGKHRNTIYRVIFSKDNQRVLTVSSDATLRMWDLKKEMELFSLHLPTQPFSPTVPLRDFDFYCFSNETCYVAVPLTSGQLVLITAKIDLPLS
jgi:WD40 repeat protein/Na+-transporting methylmalonyl-CoA/oxaloacetate decarboxylase gamma subunit/ABC-type oligopeptide transport system ATPase subunit